MRTNFQTKLLVLLMLLTLVAACAEEPEQGGTSLDVSSQALVSQTDVAKIQFGIQKVDCLDPESELGPLVLVDRDIEDQLIPGNLDDLKNEPLDEDSAHHFADLFKVVEPGCYNVGAIPFQEGGDESEDCEAAWKFQVEAVEGQTTEVLLINQCHGSDPSAIDVIAALNREPEIDDGYFVESKFVCGAAETFCAQAHDVDADPLELGLSVIGAAPCEIVAGAQTGEPGTGVEQCWEITCHDWVKVELQLTVWDLLWADGDLVRFEDWEEDQGYGTPEGSRAELALFAYFDGIKYYLDADSDGYGDENAEATLVCEDEDPPKGYVTDNTDCDDDNSNTYPGAPEICDGEDNDCNGETDEGLTTDADGDGYTTPDSCEGSKDDCNDGDPSINPGAEEVCDDGIDNNCDGNVDEDCAGPDPECAGQCCGGFTECNAGGSCADRGVCGSTAEGGGLCVDGSTNCGSLSSCTDSSDCSSGGLCFVCSCCAGSVCVPPERFCSNTGQSILPDTGDGPTIAGY